MNKFEYKNLSPFKWFVLENFPFIEADFDALTDWQLYCKLGKEINKIIDSQNVVGTEMENVTNAFIELQNYVDNYFKNLDVQDEINNKLNEMAKDGTLEEIISQYITTNIVRSFNNIDDLKNNTDLEKNMTVNVLGRFEKNDGLGSLYFIREKTNEDVESDDLIFLQNNLVAEKINNYSGLTTKNNLYGIRNNACIINTNNTGISAQIMGFHNDNELATYANRDHVISYKEFRCKQPNMYAIVSVNETSVTLNSNPTNIHVGSIIDLYENNNFVKTEKYSGFVTNIQNNVVSVEHWYYYNNTATGQVPSNVSVAVIDMPTKVWVNNDNLILTSDSNVKEGVIAEYGLINEKGSSAIANGIDIVNMTGKTDWGLFVRTNDNEKRIYIGVLAQSTGVGFVARNVNTLIDSQELDGNVKFRIGKSGEILWNSLDGEYLAKTANNILKIDGNGMISKFSKKITNITGNVTLDINNNNVFLLLGSNEITVPNGKEGQIIEIYSARALNNLVINGNTYALERYKTAKLCYIGSAWIDLNNVLQINI